jgi:hypothetical protein
MAKSGKIRKNQKQIHFGVAGMADHRRQRLGRALKKMGRPPAQVIER